MGIVTTALFGFRAVAGAVDLDVRAVVGMVRFGYGDRLAGMVFSRNRPPREGGNGSSVQPTRSPSTSTGTNSSGQSARLLDPPPRFLRGFHLPARVCVAFVPQQTTSCRSQTFRDREPPGPESETQGSTGPLRRGVHSPLQRLPEATRTLVADALGRVWAAFGPQYTRNGVLRRKGR